MGKFKDGDSVEAKIRDGNITFAQSKKKAGKSTASKEPAEVGADEG
jgi:hypothetical protein